MTGGDRQVRELRAEIRHWRRGRANARLVDVLGDVYVAVFAGLMVTSMTVSVVVNLTELSDRTCVSSGCREARTALPWLVALGALVVVLSLARVFGPVFVSPATASWLLAAPVDREALLRSRLLTTTALGGLLGLVAVAGGSLLGGLGPAPAALAATTAAALAAALVGLTALSQRTGGAHGRAGTFLAAGVLWLAVLGLATGSLPVSRPAQHTSPLWWFAVVASALIAAVALVRADRGLDRLSRHQVAPGGSLLTGLSGALASLDLALAYDVLLAHRWNRHAGVRSRRGGPTGPAALIWADLTRLRRTPGSLLVVAAAVVVPYAAATAGAGRVVVLVATLTGFLAVLPLLSALRVVTRTPGLARMLPFTTASTRLSTLVVPGAVALAFGLGTLAAEHQSLGLPWADAVMVALAVAGSALASGCRWVTGRPPDYSRPLVSTPAGAVPTNLYGSALRGFDILLLTTLPMLISATASGASFSLGLSAIVLTYLVQRA